MNKQLGLFILILLSASAARATNLLDESIQLLYKPEVIDLRASQSFNTSTDNRSLRANTPADLEIGSIFLDANGNAKKVTDIYSSKGGTVIETAVPQLDEVFNEFTIPSFDIPLTAEDFVTSEDNPAVMGGRSFSTGGSTITIPVQTTLYEASKTSDDNDMIRRLNSKIKGNASYRVSTDIKVTLSGTVTINTPAISGYYKYRPLRGFKNDSALLQLSFGQTINVTVKGTAKLNQQLMIPLCGIDKQINSFTKVTGGVFLRIDMDGEVSLEMLLYESTTHTVGASLSKGKISPISGTSFDFAFRPKLSANARISAGPYLNANLKLIGINLGGLYVYTGLSLYTNGFIQASGNLGYKTNFGLYGDYTSWPFYAEANTSVFFQSSVSVLGYGIPIYNSRWIFWQYRRGI